MTNDALPRRAAKQPLLPAFVSWIGTILITAVAVCGAFLCYKMGTVYGFGIAGDRRTDQWLSVIALYTATGAFVAFPLYLIGSYRRDRTLVLISVATFLLVSGTLLAIWWFASVS